MAAAAGCYLRCTTGRISRQQAAQISRLASCVAQLLQKAQRTEFREQIIDRFIS